MAEAPGAVERRFSALSKAMGGDSLLAICHVLSAIPWPRHLITRSSPTVPFFPLLASVAPYLRQTDKKLLIASRRFVGVRERILAETRGCTIPSRRRGRKTSLNSWRWSQGKSSYRSVRECLWRRSGIARDY